MTTTLYFAYGSNLDLDGMATRCPTAEPLCVATLDDWQLTFRGVADIEEEPGERVYGALWRCGPVDMNNLDRYEGVAGGFYERLVVTVQTEDLGDVEAVVYVMVVQERDNRSLPYQGYIGTVARGYEQWGLPFAELERGLGRATKRVLASGVEAMMHDGRKRLRPVEPRAQLTARAQVRAADARQNAARRRARAAKGQQGQLPGPWQGFATSPSTNRQTVGVDTSGMSPATRAELELDARDRKAARRMRAKAQVEAAREAAVDTVISEGYYDPTVSPCQVKPRSK